MSAAAAVVVWAVFGFWLSLLLATPFLIGHKRDPIDGWNVLTLMVETSALGFLALYIMGWIG